ncbi:hypothetical protein PMZ80_000526 [Knufia obscura]|uniref:Uncharacterized protein n=1 Tax=Knufia obscura TaxID=1635080 RepID=A0ABR0S1M2_9EURO|nr:hypothetical protein PMZ80_000526 [Knufia obscura]
MSAYFSAIVFPSFFSSSNATVDDGFWQEPSTIKTKLTAADSLIAEADACIASNAAGLAAKHTISHRRNKSMQLYYAAPSA